MWLIVTIIDVLVVASLQLFILHWDYWIDVNEHYAIYNDTVDQTIAVLGCSKPDGGKRDLAKGVKAYRDLGCGCVAGRSMTDFFVADQNCRITWYDSETLWSKECLLVTGTPDVKLQSVSRLQDPALLRMQIIVCLLVLLPCMAAVVRFNRARSRRRTTRRGTSTTGGGGWIG